MQAVISIVIYQCCAEHRVLVEGVKGEDGFFGQIHFTCRCQCIVVLPEHVVVAGQQRCSSVGDIDTGTYLAIEISRRRVGGNGGGTSFEQGDGICQCLFTRLKSGKLAVEEICGSSSLGGYLLPKLRHRANG